MVKYDDDDKNYGSNNKNNHNVNARIYEITLIMLNLIPKIITNNIEP